MAVYWKARARRFESGRGQQGERVGFICDLRVEPDVIYAFFHSAGEIGRHCLLMHGRPRRGYARR